MDSNTTSTILIGVFVVATIIALAYYLWPVSKPIPNSTLSGIVPIVAPQQLAQSMPAPTQAPVSAPILTDTPVVNTNTPISVSTPITSVDVPTNSDLNTTLTLPATITPAPITIDTPINTPINTPITPMPAPITTPTTYQTTSAIVPITTQPIADSTTGSTTITGAITGAVAAVVAAITPAISSSADCNTAGANYLKSVNKTHNMPIKIGSWDTIRPGCSVQSGGDWSINWNTNSAGADTKGMYTDVPYSFLNPTTVLSAVDCDKAGTNYRAYYNKTTPRMMQSGSWNDIKPGCSVQSGGDWATHWNTNSAGADTKSMYTEVLPSFITWTAPDITPPGCTPCSIKGLYVCPADKIVAPGLWYNNQASQISSFRLPSYDPASPTIYIDGKGYYFRQAKATC